MKRSRSLSQYLLWGIVAIMVVAMGGFGFSSLLTGAGSRAAIQVGKTEIPVEEYFNALSTTINNFAREQGAPLSLEDATLIGIPDHVRGQLVRRAALGEFARESGLVVGDEALLEELTTIDAFKDESGNFSRAAFEQFLANQQLSEAEFVERLRQDMLEAMAAKMMGGSEVRLEHLAGALANQIGEKRAVEYVELDAGQYGADPGDEGGDGGDEKASPNLASHYDEALLRERFEAGRERYMSEPAKRLEIAYLIANKAEALGDEAGLRARFEAEKPRFMVPARLSYSRLAFPDEEAARAAFEAPSLDEIAKERGLSPSDYQFVDASINELPEAAQAEINDKGVGRYGPVEGMLGYEIYEVTAFEAGRERSFEEVREEIAGLIAGEALNTALEGEYDMILDMIAEGQSPRDIASASALQFVEMEGNAPEIAGLSDDPEFIREIEEAGQDEERDILKLASGGVAVVRAVGEIEPRLLEFDEAREIVAQEIKAEERNAARDALVAKFTKANKAGESFADIASSFGLTPRKSEALREDEAPGALPLALAFDMFSVKPGEIFEAHEDGRVFVAKIADIEQFDAKSESGKELTRIIGDELSAGFGEGLEGEFINAIASEYGTRLNMGLIGQAEAQIR